MSVTSSPVGTTVAEYDLPKVRLQVRDGYNLDQYLFRDDGEIAFDLDLQGLTFSAGQSATLVLRVFDVDQNGASSCGPEIDKVYVKDHYVGTLRGANDQWSESPFIVPAEDLLPDINHIRVEIDTLETGCWAVTVDTATGYNRETCPLSTLAA